MRRDNTPRGGVKKSWSLKSHRDASPDIEESYHYYSKIFSTKPYATLEGVEFTAQILKKNRPKAKDIQAKDYVNNRFVGELEKEGFLARVFGGW